MNDNKISTLVEDIHEKPRCADWGAKLQYACEAIWRSLDDSGSNSNLAETLIGLLQLEDALLLARLVIPELREHSAPSLTNPSKQMVIKKTEHARMEVVELEIKTQSDFDEPLYRDEKSVFTEQEMYRASLLLHRTAAFNDVEEKEIMDWLARRPTKSANGD